MGCSGSKSTKASEPKQDGGPNNENEAKADNAGQNEAVQENGGADLWVTEEEAAGYVQTELGVSEERAKKIVALVNKNDDGKVSNEELIKLWEKVKQARDEVRPKFEEYDKDSTGFVTLDEATEVLKGKFKDVSEDSLKAMISRYDDNSDGRFNYNEFVFFYGNIYARKEQLEEKFKELDKDGSGNLEKDTVCDTLCQECVLEDKMARSLVEDFDVNKDGKINKEEFFNIWNKLF